jgi:hypothetical protein
MPEICATDSVSDLSLLLGDESIALEAEADRIPGEGGGGGGEGRQGDQASGGGGAAAGLRMSTPWA